MAGQNAVSLVSGPYFWLIVACIAMGNFMLRAVFVFAMERIHLTENIRLILKYIPVSVLSALVVPAIVLYHGEIVFFSPEQHPMLAWVNGHERIFAGLAAIAASFWKPGMLPIIVAGMAALYILQALFGQAVSPL